MTNNEIDSVLVNMLQEMNRLNSRVESVHKVVTAILSQSRTVESQAELRALLAAHQPDMNSQSLFQEAQTIRERIENVARPEAEN